MNTRYNVGCCLSLFFVMRCCHLLTEIFISIIFTTEAQSIPEYIEEVHKHK